MAEGKANMEGNRCGCDKQNCSTHQIEHCPDPTCKEYKACCEPGCDGCKKKCNDVKPEKCKCRLPRCGCKDDCYVNGGGDGTCKGKVSGKCQRCSTRCEDGKPCLCYRCSCGPRCNGVICSCCSWCDPRNCSGNLCDGYVIGRCRDKKLNQCEGHVKYHNGDPVWERNTYGKDCNKSHPDECDKDYCKWARGKIDKDGNCIIKCKYCGTLCGQDKFRRCCYIAIPVVIIVLVFLIFRFMVPEKYHSMMTRIRAAFPSSPRHPGRSLNNLVGDRLPEEMNVDRHPAFRPRAYAGLA